MPVLCLLVQNRSLGQCGTIKDGSLIFLIQFFNFLGSMIILMAS